MNRYIRFFYLAGLMVGSLFLFSSCEIIDMLLNHAPEVDLSASSTSVLAGEVVTLTATTSDPDGDPVSLVWTLDGHEQTVTDAIVDFDTSAYTSDTSVTVMVTADDGRTRNNSATASLVITITANQPPTVSLSATATSTRAGTAVSYTASASDPDGDSLVYAWAVDGTTRTGQTGTTFEFDTTSYSAAANVTISVTVTDAHNATATDSENLAISINHAPTVSLSASATSVNTGTTVSFTTTASDPDGDTLSYGWTVNGVATSVTSSTAELATDSYTTTTTVVIGVTVSDGYGGTDSDSLSITITANQAPTVSLSVNDSSLYSDQNGTFTASASDPDGDTLTYTWYVDGVQQSNTTASVSWYWLNTAYLSPTIKVRVTDPDGAFDEDSLSISITPAASVRYINRTGAYIWYIYCRKYGYSSWGTDLLGSNTLANNSYFILYGITDVSSWYDFKAVNSSGTYWEASGGYVLMKGYYRNFWLYPSYWTLDGNSQATSSVLADLTGPNRGLTANSSPSGLPAKVLPGILPANAAIRQIKEGAESADHPQDQPYTAD